MTGDELQEVVTQLAARYAQSARQTESRELTADGWVIETEDVYALIRASKVTNPFIWIKAGLGLDVPRSESLAYDISLMNKALVVGRIYMDWGDDRARVIFDETVFGAYLSWSYTPSIQDVVSRFETSLTHARDIGAKLIANHGGRRMSGEDWMHLAL